MAEPSPAAQIVINRLVNDLQVIGVWPLFDYLIAANQADQDAALISIKDPLNMAAVVSSPGMQFTPYLGFASDFSGGGSGHARLRAPLDQSNLAGKKFQQNNNWLGFWSETEQSADSTAMCGTDDNTINPRSAAGQMRVRNSVSATDVMNVTSSKGLFMSRRVSAAAFEAIHITEFGVVTRQTFTRSSATLKALAIGLSFANFNGGNDQYSTRFWSLQLAGGCPADHQIKPTFWAFKRFRIGMAALA